MQIVPHADYNQNGNDYIYDSINYQLLTNCYALSDRKKNINSQSEKGYQNKRL
jgi:hypothetical protein